MSEVGLQIDGAVERAVSLNVGELAAFANEDRVADVSELEARRQGEAVRLSALLNRVTPKPEATHVTLHSTDGFSASLSLPAVADLGLVIFQIDGCGLENSAGGPFRFLIPNAAACKTAELDSCANVKLLGRIELTAGPGRDTR